METFYQCLSDGVETAKQKVLLLSRNAISIGSYAPSTIDLSEVGTVLGDEGDVVSGVGMTLNTASPMKYLTLMSPETKSVVVNAIMGEGASDDEELADSILQELGNIFGSTIANVIAEAMGCSITTSHPEVVSDMAGAIVASVITTLEDVDDTVFLMKVELMVHDSPLDCGVYLFFNEGTALMPMITDNKTVL